MRRRANKSEVIINTKFRWCSRKMGEAGARRSPVMEAPFLREGTTIRVLSDAPSRFFSSGRCINKALSIYPSDKNDEKKTTIFILNGFFSVFRSLLMYPLAKKERNFLLMYPLFVFPYLRTLRAVFSETMCFYADPRQGSGESGRLLMHPSVTSTPPSDLAGLESLARRFPKICGVIFLSIFSSSLLQKHPFSFDLSRN